MMPAWLNYTVCTLVLARVAYTLFKTFAHRLHERLLGWLPFVAKGGGRTSQVPPVLAVVEEEQQEEPKYTA